MTLNELAVGEEAILSPFSQEPGLQPLILRLMGIGLKSGDSVKVVHKAPLKGPLMIKGETTATFALRYLDACRIQVERRKS